MTKTKFDQPETAAEKYGTPVHEKVPAPLAFDHAAFEARLKSWVRKELLLLHGGNTEQERIEKNP